MTTTPIRPRFSIVSAVRDGETELPAFIASVEAQRFDLGRAEVIVVDDGSTDGSAARLADWAARRPDLVRLVTTERAGHAAARNRGLAEATGEWVTFVDGDGRLEPDFLAVADRFATAHPDVEVMAGRIIGPADDGGRAAGSERHSVQSDRGDRRLDLDHEPNTFTDATVGFFRLDRLRQLGLEFAPRIGPDLEDTHLAACMLLGLDRPRIGLLRDARVLGPSRAMGDLDAWEGSQDPERHVNVLAGLLDLFDRARARGGAIPPWLQHLVIHESAIYLEGDETITATIQIPQEQIPAFHALLCRIIAQLDPAAVRAYRAPWLRSAWMDILEHACRGRDWHSSIAARTKVDAAAGLQRISYRYVGTPPSEEFLVHGTPVTPRFGKVMSHRYHGRSLMEERIAWLPAGPLVVRIGGKRLRIVRRFPAPAGLVRPTSPSAWVSLVRTTPARVLLQQAAVRAAKMAYRIVALPIRLIARLPPYRSRFRDAWVLMDRIYNADDNGERLFEHLRAERPDINAWFVIEKGTLDWRRLKDSGQRRVVAHGSWTWIMLMLNCSWVVSSHAPRAVAAPPRVTRMLVGPTWRFAFLQHGITKDDLSKWLNNRDMDLLVVSTVPELESVVADGTGYRYTTREARNTGLPRFDRLLAKGREVAEEDRDLILIAPTWRMWLTDVPDVNTHRRIVDDAFWTSDYLLSWLGILRSPEIAAAAARHGRRVAFMPHPNMQVMLPEIELPEHVEPLTFVGNDVQGLYARCALLVTDYSSVAFNAAVLDRPVVYYQFDRDAVMSGAHLGRKGYFEYERDGFGPVVTGADDAVRAIVAAIEHGPRPTADYQDRIDRTFVNRDGRACARVVAAIEELSQPSAEPIVGGADA